MSNDLVTTGILYSSPPEALSLGAWVREVDNGTGTETVECPHCGSWLPAEAKCCQRPVPKPKFLPPAEHWTEKGEK